MGNWSQVGQKGESNLPILKIGEKPVRLRFIAGHGKYAGPEERWQHWPPEGEKNRTPIACIGTRGGCIFHQAPIKWVKKAEDGGARLAKSYAANVVVYEMDKAKVVGRKVEVFIGNQVYEIIAQQCAMVGCEPNDYDWIVGKSGSGQQTKYSATMVPADRTIEPNGIDFDAHDGLNALEDQAPENADAQNPKLVDFDKFEGFKSRTPAEQATWYEGRGGNDETTDPAEAASADAPVTPPAAPVEATAKPKINLPKPGEAKPAATVAAPPPKPPAPVAAPPPPPVAKGPSQEEIASATTIIEGWNAGSSTNVEHLNHVIENDAFDATYKEAATLLLSLAGTDDPAAAFSATITPEAEVAEDNDLEACKEELKTALTSWAVFKKSFPNMKKFFQLAGEGKNALNALDLDDLHKLLAITRLGEEAVIAAIG